MNFAPDLASWLRLQQFADSGLPIGGSAHSFGLESLIDAGLLDVDGIDAFLVDYLEEAGSLEAAYCIASCNLAGLRGGIDQILDEWLALNVALGARKLARESRDGSAALGRRFLDLAARVSRVELLVAARERVKEAGTQVHLAACFGLVAGAMGFGGEMAAGAYLQQSMTALISCCQRLLPLGQTRAHQILWNLKSGIAGAVVRGATLPASSVSSFTPLLDVVSARHPSLHTRLFMS